MATYLLMVLIDDFLVEVNIAIAWFHVPVLTTLGFVLQLSFVLLFNRCWLRSRPPHFSRSPAPPVQVV